MYLRAPLLALFFLFIAGFDLYSQKDESSLISPSVDNIFDFYVSSSDKVYFGNNESLWIYDLIQDTLVNETDLDLKVEITAIIASEERNEAFLGTKDGSILVVDYQNNNLTHFVTHKDDRITALAFDYHKNNLIAGGIKGKVYSHSVADVNNYEVLFSGSEQVTDIESSPDGDYLAVCDGSGTISLFDPVNLSSIYSLKASGDFIRDLVFVPGSNRFVTVDDNGVFKKWRVSPSKEIVNLNELNKSSSWLLAVDVSPNGKAYSFGGVNQKLYVDTPFGSYEKRLEGPLLKTYFFEKSEYIFFVNCIYGKGIFLSSLADI